MSNSFTISAWIFGISEVFCYIYNYLFGNYVVYSRQ